MSVGMLTADLAHLGRDIAVLEGTGVGVVHFDVMDGCFCPMTTIGSPIVKAVQTSMIEDVHLMIEAPLHKVADYVAAGADIVTVHVEADRYVRRCWSSWGRWPTSTPPTAASCGAWPCCRARRWQHSSPSSILVDYVMILAVDPGGGEKFGTPTPERVAQLRTLIAASGRDILVGVDGGVAPGPTSAEVAATGADLVITGQRVFDGVDPAGNAAFMLDALARRDIVSA